MLNFIIIILLTLKFTQKSKENFLGVGLLEGGRDSNIDTQCVMKKEDKILEGNITGLYDQISS